MGVIQSLTVEKGGDDKLWNVDGMPMEVNVTLTVQDMYPTMAMTKNSSLMAFNIGLQSYLDCMGGIRSDKILDMMRMNSWLRAKMSKIHSKLTTGLPLMIGDGYQEFMNNILK